MFTVVLTILSVCSSTFATSAISFTKSTPPSLQMKDVAELENLDITDIVRPEPAIVHGLNARRGQFPYIISLRIDRIHVCGGSLISPTLMLTAAHCFKNGVVLQRFSAVLNATNRDNNKEGFETRIRRIVIHPNYRSNNTNGDYDIALVHLGESTRCFGPDSRVVNVRLPSANQSFSDISGNGKVLVASGWGKTSGDASSATVLQYASMTLITYKACKDRWPPRSLNISSYVFCTSSQFTDICQGDSGGPLVLNVEGRSSEPILVGVTSKSSRGCGVTTELYSASIFTRVSKFVTDFIEPEMLRLNSSLDHVCRSAPTWLVQVIVKDFSVYCTGAFVGRGLVVTSARCLHNPSNEEHQIATEDQFVITSASRPVDQSRIPSVGVLERITDRYYSYTEAGRNYDTAALVVKEENYKPVAATLPSQSTRPQPDFDNTTLKLYGWNSKENSDYNTAVKFFRFAQCKKIFGGANGLATSSTFCVRAPDSVACNLDGGAVVVREVGDKEEVVGIVIAASQECGQQADILCTWTAKYTELIAAAQMKNDAGKKSEEENSSGLLTADF